MPNAPIKVNVIWDVSVGVNTHILVPPPPAPPVPVFVPSVEMIATQLWTFGYALNLNKLTTTVKHKSVRIVIDGHDCGILIPDVTIPPANVYLPIIWLGSSRKIAFAASTVQMDGTATGLAMPIVAPMMTCGEPVTMPTAQVLTAWLNSVQVGMTLADCLFGWLGVLASVAIDLVMFELGGGRPSPTSLLNRFLPSRDDLIKQTIQAFTGLIISSIRYGTSGGAYPITFQGQWGTPFGNVSLGVQYTGSGWPQVSGGLNVLGDQGTASTQADSAGRHTRGDRSGDSLTPPDNRSGWSWSPGGGWTR